LGKSESPPIWQENCDATVIPGEYHRNNLLSTSHFRVPRESRAMKILPAIDLRDGRCVRLRQGDYGQETIFSDDPVAIARQWADQGAQRIHLVDLDGARAGRPVNQKLIAKMVRAVDVPCQVGGGLRDETAIREMLEEVGIDRVIIGTQALKQPDWFAQICRKWPDQVALGVDARDSFVATEGWLDVSQTSVFEMVDQYVGLPLAAIIYTNIANDGMMQGVDQQTLQDLGRLSDLGFPTIASGGVTTLEDIRRLAAVARTHPNLVGAIVGRALYEGTIGVPDAIAAITSS
jgi:phosphoribosylformimino-5-aminoimidazole carboxamide ribotide isomerase